MRLAQLSTLNRLVEERQRLISERALIRDGRELGPAMDRAMLELLRPVVIGELSGRLRKIEAELADLGVDLT